MRARRPLRALVAAVCAAAPAVLGGRTTLYCFALVTPGTKEPSMLAAQFLLKLGVFQCDEYSIISNVSAAKLLAGHWEAAEGVQDRYAIVATELLVKQIVGPPGFDASDPWTNQGSGQLRGGVTAKHLANTQVFQKVWKKVFGLKKFLEHDWTVKLDVDAVILPQRLRGYLHDRPKRSLAWDPEVRGEQLPFQAEYLLNAEHDVYGNFLHGPAEVVSKGGMQLFSRGADRCEDRFSTLPFGEDFYLNKCLEYLGVPSVPPGEVSLLYDTYEFGELAVHTCGPIWEYGQQRYFAVYHAHKTVEDWLQCYAQARVGPKISEKQKQNALAEAKRKYSAAPPPPTSAPTEPPTTTVTTRTTTTMPITPTKTLAPEAPTLTPEMVLARVVPLEMAGRPTIRSWYLLAAVPVLAPLVSAVFVILKHRMPVPTVETPLMSHRDVLVGARSLEGSPVKLSNFGGLCCGRPLVCSRCWT